MSELVALAAARGPCPAERDGARIREAYGSFLTDESRLTAGVPAALYLPRTTAEASAAVAECAQSGLPLVISGGRTGIVGGAVAQPGGALLSLDSLKAEPVVRWNERLRCFTATVAAGLRLEELQERLRRGDAAGLPGPDRLFYPVDPTEVSATLGGTVATNASGARTLALRTDPAVGRVADRGPRRRQQAARRARREPGGRGSAPDRARSRRRARSRGGRRAAAGHQAHRRLPPQPGHGPHRPVHRRRRHPRDRHRGRGAPPRGPGAHRGPVRVRPQRAGRRAAR